MENRTWAISLVRDERKTLSTDKLSLLVSYSEVNFILCRRSFHTDDKVLSVGAELALCADLGYIQFIQLHDSVSQRTRSAIDYTVAYSFIYYYAEAAMKHKNI